MVFRALKRLSGYLPTVWPFNVTFRKLCKKLVLFCNESFSVSYYAALLAGYGADLTRVRSALKIMIRVFCRRFLCDPLHTYLRICVYEKRDN